MRNLERQRLCAGAHDHAQRGDVVATIHAQSRATRRLLIPAWPRATALAIQKTLHIGQKGHKFLVVALLELAWVGGELVLDPRPQMRAVSRFQQLPMAALFVVTLSRHQLQRPQQHLPKMTNEMIGAVEGNHAHALLENCCAETINAALPGAETIHPPCRCEFIRTFNVAPLRMCLKINARINSHLHGLGHARRQHRRNLVITITRLFQHLDAVFA